MAVVVEEPTPMLDGIPEPPPRAAEAVEDEPEIDVQAVPEPEPSASGSQPAAKSGGWISSLIRRLSPSDKPKR
jgi:hypothetical protein